ncbi:MAG TPA: AsmA-like C-terminal region-containing protein [Luteolibacter sp.]
MSFRRAWRICWWLLRHGSRLLLWTVWLALLALLVGQARLLSSRHMSVPEPLRRVLVERLAAHDLRFDYKRGRMDFSGRVILEKVVLGPVSSNDPLVTARLVYLHFDLWSLLAGQPDIEEITVSGLDLHLPAARSPSAVDEIPAGRIDFTLKPQGGEIELSSFSGYIGRLPVHASGHFRLPAPRSASAGSGYKQDIARINADWIDLARRAQELEARLAVCESPRVHLQIKPYSVLVSVQADSVDLRAIPGGAAGKLGGVRIQTELPLQWPLKAPVTLAGSAAALELPRMDFYAQGLAFRLRAAPGGAYGIAPESLDLQLASVRLRDIETGAITVAASQLADDRVRADVSVLLAGSPWQLQADVAPRSGEGVLTLDGAVDDATLAFAGGLIHHDLNALLDPVQAAPLHASARFLPGWKLAEATGRLHSGFVRVGTVQLDETGTEFTYDGHRVLCDALVLRQGESLAHGSYGMDTRTMDFRFLLTGRLRPMGISGWFHNWWSDFWQGFDFARSAPQADVDVQGRWGDLTATRVFVQAEGEGAGLKGAAFDRVGTRLFLRPQWFDILRFDVARDGQEAGGWLSRSLDLEKNTWRHMEFSVDSRLPLATIRQLFPEESAELLAPYVFTSPPRLQIKGRVDSAVSPAGKHENIDLDLTSSGPMTFHAFPLADLAVQAHVRDDRIELPVLAVNFAGGEARGKALLSGPANTRKLSFDVSLAKGHLGAVTQAIASLQPPAAPVSEKAAEAARVRQQRLENGRLDFSLAAEGLMADFYSFKGPGTASITGTELGQLNLFGPLSEALRGTFINLGSFSLTTVEAPFKLDGERVRFDDLRVSGPSALLIAKGDYWLRGGQLDFNAKIHPFDESTSLVGNAVGFVLTPLSKVFEVKLKGTLAEPSWIFAYGPSRLFNTITGGDKTPKPTAPATPPPTAAP